MEPQSAGTTRPYTAADCRKEALFQGFMCAVCLNMVFSPPHWALLLRWAVILMFLILGCIYARSTIYWLLLSRYLGQAVTWRIGPRGHTWWQRTVTYPIPRMSAKAADQFLPTPFSIIITVALTVLTGAWTFVAIALLAAATALNQRIGLFCLVLDIPLFVYNAYCWRRVVQDRQRLKVPQETTP